MALTFDALREYCLKKKDVTEDFPFDENTLVFRVSRKIFLLLDITSRPLNINLKCEPVHAIELREKYDSVQPGYHMNKKHWNTVEIDGTIPLKEIFSMIDHSYDLVVKGMKKSEKE